VPEAHTEKLANGSGPQDVINDIHDSLCSSV
jgi:hypothetical protein